MPFDGSPPIPDLSVPSLANLAYALRHRETWPPTFHWDYRFFSSCAIGLSLELWPRSTFACCIPMAIFVEVRPPMRWRDFLTGPRSLADVQPQHVADAIDRLPPPQ